MLTFKCKRGELLFVYSGKNYGRDHRHVNFTSIPMRPDQPSENLILNLGQGENDFEEIIVLNGLGYEVDKIVAPKQPAQQVAMSQEELSKLTNVAVKGTRKERRARAAAND